MQQKNRIKCSTDCPDARFYLNMAEELRTCVTIMINLTQIFYFLTKGFRYKRKQQKERSVDVRDTFRLSPAKWCEQHRTVHFS